MLRSKLVIAHTYMSRCQVRATVLVVLLTNQISLAKSKEESFPEFSNSSIDDGNSRHQWLGGKIKVNSHQVPLLITDKGPNLGLDLCQSTSKVVTFLDQFC